MSILWGKDKQLDYWAALEADQVPAAERRAMGLLASISDEKRFSFYCLAGMFPAMGNVTKRTYLVRRWTTVMELEDGQPRASWCILAQDRMIAPETDHVIAMKNILEGSEMHFREIGNAFHYSEDPFRGKVDPQTSFPNPYYNEIGPAKIPAQLPPAHERDWNEDSALQFKELEGWMKTLQMKAEINAEARLAHMESRSQGDSAARHQLLYREALVERAKDWVRIPPKERYKLPPTQFERMADRAMGAMQNVALGYGLGGVGGQYANTAATGITFGVNTNTTANFYINNAGTITQPVILHQQGYNPTLA